MIVRKHAHHWGVSWSYENVQTRSS